MQGLSHVINEKEFDTNQGDKFITPIHKLDSFEELQGDDVNITGIKMDVENYEYFVLEGGKEIIERNTPVIYTELWESENRNKCFELLKDIGYKPFIYWES